MELHQLRYALAVVDHGTFTAAAAACFVAQPSLSHAIRILERELGVELFAPHRTARHADGRRRGLRPPRAGGAAGRSTRCVADVGRRRRGGRRPPRPGRPPHARRRPGDAAGRRVPGRHPGVTVRLAHPEGTGELWSLVRSGDSELGHHRAAGDGGHASRRCPLGRQELVAILPPAQAPRARLDLAALAERPIVTQRRGTSTRDALDAALATVGATATIAVETDQREAIVPLVLAGAGAAVVPRPMAAVAAQQGAVVASLRPALHRQLGLIHRDAPLSPAARAFIELARSR